MSERKKHALCTLFNSLYLDKGIVLYKSLEKVCPDLILYVLAMDDKCYEVLSDLNFPSLIPIKLSIFETNDLLVAKSNRPFGQYCWTCSSSLIKYVLDMFKPDYCTYLDADMAFYDDPYVLVEELERRNASVSIVAHRFCWYDKKHEKTVGKYCVECNTFKNDKKADAVLAKWIAQCLDDCSQKKDGIHWGDQKYMDTWVDDYDCVIESDNMGAGVAPWNISQYKLERCEDEKIWVSLRGNILPILFFHFEAITFPSEGVIKIGYVYDRWNVDRKLEGKLYQPYLMSIWENKEYLLSAYGINIFFKHHPASSGISETHLEKFVRRLKILFSSNIVTILFHSLPNRLFGKRNFMKI